MSIFQKNNNPSKFRNSEKAATPKTAQLLGFKTVLDITRTPYDGFPQNLDVSYSNFEAFLAVIVQKNARMLVFPQIDLNTSFGGMFQKYKNRPSLDFLIKFDVFGVGMWGI